MTERKRRNYDNMSSRFHRIPACDGPTDRQTDGRTELLSISRVSMLTRDIDSNSDAIKWYAYSTFPISPFYLLYLHYTVTEMTRSDVALQLWAYLVLFPIYRQITV